MIRALLLAVDTSASSRTAARYALTFCRGLGARLRALHAVDKRLLELIYSSDAKVSLRSSEGPTPAELRKLLQRHLEDRGQAVLEGIKQQAKQIQVHCKTEMRTGVPAAVILEAAQGVDLIVLGQHGESASLGEHADIGAVAGRIVRSANHPVLVTSDHYHDPQRIFLGYDGSERTYATLVFVAELARNLQLPVHAVSVSENIRTAKAHLTAVTRYSEQQGFLVTTQSSTGQPADVLLEMSQEGDVIALGSFGDRGLREWWLGSTSKRVLSEAQQPVLLHR